MITIRILLLGDTHGNPYAIQYAFQTAINFHVDRIFQLGDYGLWEHMNGGEEFLQVTSELAVRNGIPFYWLDGNHECFPWLRMTEVERQARIAKGQSVPPVSYSANVTTDGMWEIRDGLYYSPRGNTFTWDGVKFLTFGGAFSVDRNQRRVGFSFWFEEEIQDSEVTAAIAGADFVDILLCHDVPDGVPMDNVMRNGSFRPIREAEAGRKKLRRIVDSFQPRNIYHGHYHVRYNDIVNFGYGPVRVCGLSCDGSGADSWEIIDTKDWNSG